MCRVEVLYKEISHVALRVLFLHPPAAGVGGKPILSPDLELLNCNLHGS